MRATISSICSAEYLGDFVEVFILDPSVTNEGRQQLQFTRWQLSSSGSFKANGATLVPMDFLRHFTVSPSKAFNFRRSSFVGAEQERYQTSSEPAGISEPAGVIVLSVQTWNFIEDEANNVR